MCGCGGGSRRAPRAPVAQSQAVYQAGRPAAVPRNGLMTVTQRSEFRNEGEATGAAVADALCWILPGELGNLCRRGLRQLGASLHRDAPGRSSTSRSRSTRRTRRTSRR